MASKFTTEEEQRAKEEHVRQILAGLNTAANFATNPAGRGALVQRLGSAAVAHHVQHLEHEQEVAKLAKVAYADWESIAIAALIEKHLGPEWVTYEPETIIESVPIGVDQLTQALCARQVLYDHTPFTDWHVFEKVAIAFNNRIPNFDSTQDFSSHELAWAVEQMRRIDPSTPFSEEVKNYIAIILRDAGCILCPDALVDCQPNLDRITSDYGHEIKHACENLSDAPSEAVEHQRQLRASCSTYLALKNSKLVKELEQVA